MDMGGGLSQFRFPICRLGMLTSQAHREGQAGFVLSYRGILPVGFLLASGEVTVSRDFQGGWYQRSDSSGHKILFLRWCDAIYWDC